MNNNSSEYIIYINDQNFSISGTTVAWDAYHRAIDFGVLIGARVMLIDGETGEILLDSWDEE